jgi:outer membrane protein OmpA-like peptidoglycan-associated protein
MDEPDMDATGKLLLPSPTFDVGKGTLRPEGEAIVQRVADLMKARPDLTVRVEVHTDGLGAAAANQALSDRRADTVGRWLVDHGIECRRVGAVGYGETRPIAPNDTAENRLKNRRVEFIAGYDTYRQLCAQPSYPRHP